MCMKLALPALVIACVVGTWGCSSNHLPSSPSSLNSQNPASSGAGRFRAFDDPVMPSPMQILINIVGSFGSTAFMPNPTTANMGDQIVFTNTDLVMNRAFFVGVYPGLDSAQLDYVASVFTRFMKGERVYAA